MSHILISGKYLFGLHLKFYLLTWAIEQNKFILFYKTKLFMRNILYNSGLFGVITIDMIKQEINDVQFSF